MKAGLRDIDFYFVTDSKLTRKSVLEDVKSAVKAGVKIVQYREKEKPTKEMIEEAKKIKEVCDKNNVLLLIDDRVDIALAVGADGVHLGNEDIPYDLARKLLPDKIIGLSAHNIKEAVEAEKIGADYISIGPIFKTKTKLNAKKPIGLNPVKEVRKKIKIPFIAIGGINLENLQSVLDAGAKSAAAISAIVAKEDVEKEVRKFREAIRKTYIYK